MMNKRAVRPTSVSQTIAAEFVHAVVCLRGDGVNRLSNSQTPDKRIPGERAPTADVAARKRGMPGAATGPRSASPPKKVSGPNPKSNISDPKYPTDVFLVAAQNPTNPAAPIAGA